MSDNSIFPYSRLITSNELFLWYKYANHRCKNYAVNKFEIGNTDLRAVKRV